MLRDTLLLFLVAQAKQAHSVILFLRRRVDRKKASLGFLLLLVARLTGLQVAWLLASSDTGARQADCGVWGVERDSCVEQQPTTPSHLSKNEI